MDWSLALVSQGIETSIEQPADGFGWGLAVPAPDYEKALRVLRQYHLENRGWPWRQPLPWPRTHFDWAAAVWAALLVVFYWVSGNHADFQAKGVMDSAAVMSGQWWRIFTAILLHADLAHLAANLSIGIVLLGLAMGRYGTGLGLLAAFLAGAGGNVASLLLNAKPFYGLGASGLVMGALGLLAAQSMVFGKLNRHSWKFLMGGIAAAIMLFVLFGLTPGTDIAAHFGGFVAGLLIGALLTMLPVKFVLNSKSNLAAASLLVALVIVTWRLALNG